MYQRFAALGLLFQAGDALARLEHREHVGDSDAAALEQDEQMVEEIGGFRL